MIQLRPYQLEDAQRIATAFKNRSAAQMGIINGSEMGLGKTSSTMKALELAEIKTCLVLCPALARQEWRRQFDLHFPNKFDYAVVKASKDFKKLEKQPQILITGYNPLLLKNLPEDWAFEVVVCDECQEISNPESKTSQLVRDIIERGDSFVIPLSGTPALDKPEQIYHILSLCEPNAWGDHIVQFKHKWLERVPCEWSPSGKAFGGLKPEKRELLSQRISKVMIRRTQKEVMSDLPPLIMSLRYVEGKKANFDWDDPASYEVFAAANFEPKNEVAMEVFEELRGQGLEKFVFLTYNRNTADIIGAQLATRGVNVEIIDGAVAPDARQKKIDKISGATGISAIVCTIDSVGVAIDFTWAHAGIFVETHWQPGMTSQAALRFRRLSTLWSIYLVFIAVQDSREERKIKRYIEKQEALNIVSKNGEFEQGALTTFSGMGNDLGPEDLSDFL